MKQNSNPLYSICKSKTSEEYHIFPSRRNGDGRCFPTQKTSLCGAVDTNNQEKCLSTCITNDEVRIFASKTDKDLCGNCMGVIHKTER